VAIVAGAVLGVAGIVGVLALRDRLADDSHGNHASIPACDGEPVDGAPAYDAGSGAASIVVLDGRSGSWDARGESEATADLVVCRTWNAEPVRTTWCDYRDDRNGEQFYVEVGYHRAALVVREARTGAVVGEHEVVAADESCPVNMAALIESGERRTSKNLYPEDEVRAVVDGYRASDTA